MEAVWWSSHNYKDGESVNQDGRTERFTELNIQAHVLLWWPAATYKMLLIGSAVFFWNWEESAQVKKASCQIRTPAWCFPLHVLAFQEAQLAELRLEVLHKHVAVRKVRLEERIMLSKVAPLQAVLRCEAPEHVQNSARWAGCIIESAECVGAPLLCSRLTESGPVSEAAQADSMERLAAFDVNWVQLPNAKWSLSWSHERKWSFRTSMNQMGSDVMGCASGYWMPNKWIVNKACRPQTPPWSSSAFSSPVSLVSLCFACESKSKKDTALIRRAQLLWSDRNICRRVRCLCVECVCRCQSNHPYCWWLTAACFVTYITTQGRDPLQPYPAQACARARAHTHLRPFILILTAGHLQGSAYIMTSSQHLACFESIHAASHYASPPGLLSLTASEASLDYTALHCAQPWHIITYWSALCNPAWEENAGQAGGPGAAVDDTIASTVSTFTTRSLC